GEGQCNTDVARDQALLALGVATALLDVPARFNRLPLLVAATLVGTAGWFFFYAIVALRIRRNDAYNTVTSVFYFVFLFASSMFYPLDPLPRMFRIAAFANPITWHIDVLRYATIGVGDAVGITVEAIAFVLFTAVAFAAAIRALRDAG